MSNQPQYQSTTQIYLDVHDITNDLLIMKDGTVSMIITVDAMNFGLLAEEEQDAVMYAYAGLLNSLNYPIQIVIRSQTKDVTSYLFKLKEQEDLASSRENQDRIRRYRDFVSNLIRERNVLDKKFYVSIPATSIELGLLPPSTVIPGNQAFDIGSIEKSVLLEKARSILEPKRDHIIGQFGRIGLYSRQLTTQEIIQFFYLSYNPEAAEGQQLTDTNNYTTPLVSASVDESVLESMNTMTNDDVQPVSPVVDTASVISDISATQTQVAPTESTPAPKPVSEPVPAQPVEPVQPQIVETPSTLEDKPLEAPMPQNLEPLEYQPPVVQPSATINTPIQSPVQSVPGINPVLETPTLEPTVPPQPTPAVEVPLQQPVPVTPAQPVEPAPPASNTPRTDNLYSTHMLSKVTPIWESPQQLPSRPSTTLTAPNRPSLDQGNASIEPPALTNANTIEQAPPLTQNQPPAIPKPLQNPVFSAPPKKPEVPVFTNLEPVVATPTYASTAENVQTLESTTPVDIADPQKAIDELSQVVVADPAPAQPDDDLGDMPPLPEIK